MNKTKRTFDLILALFFVILFLPFIIFISIVIFLQFSGPVLFWSKRVGKNNVIFLMPKFRSMDINAPLISKTLFADHSAYINFFGQFLRSTSLDELPQLYSVIKGDMSLIGPRPALYSENDLIKLRTIKKIHKLYPGITGYAQINGRDNIKLLDKVNLDYFYLKNLSFSLDLKILILTVYKVLLRKDIYF